jgi:hypothetical protein
LLASAAMNQLLPGGIDSHVVHASFDARQFNRPNERERLHASRLQHDHQEKTNRDDSAHGKLLTSS